MNRHSATHRYSTIAAAVVVALICASCGRLPSEAASPATNGDENPFNSDRTSDTADIAGVIVTSDGTVLPPAELGEEAGPTTTGNSEIDGNAAPVDAPPAAPVTPEPVQKPDPVVPGSGNLHTVALGESLSTIASEYGITIQSLRDFNDLDSDTIIEGQELRIPQR